MGPFLSMSLFFLLLLPRGGGIFFLLLFLLSDALRFVGDASHWPRFSFSFLLLLRFLLLPSTSISSSLLLLLLLLLPHLLLLLSSSTRSTSPSFYVGFFSPTRSDLLLDVLHIPANFLLSLFDMVTLFRQPAPPSQCVLLAPPPIFPPHLQSLLE